MHKKKKLNVGKYAPKTRKHKKSATKKTKTLSIENLLDEGNNIV